MPEPRAKTTKRFDAKPVLASRVQHRLSRWTSWARSLINRYGPVMQPHNSLEMTLVQPFTTIRLIRERWLNATRELKPQINFFFDRNLRVSWRHMPGIINSIGVVRHENHIRTASHALASASLHPGDFPGNLDHKHANEPDSVITSWSSLANHHLNQTVLESNVRALVTTWGRAIDETSRVRFSNRILENADALAQRLLAHTRRIEARIDGPATLRQISAAPAGQTAFTKPSVDDPSAQARTAAYEGAAAQRQAEFGGRGIDVGRLTDRIVRELDRRVVAVRERMGRT